VPSQPFSGPSALVGEPEVLRHIFDIACGDLLSHLVVTHPLSIHNNNRSKHDVGDGVSYLGEVLDEITQRLSWVLLHDLEVGLYIGS
jgi:hypothetical protein